VFTLSGITIASADLKDSLAVEVDGKDMVEDDYCTISSNTVTCANMSERVD
jgi:hypothetical protein